MWGLSADRENFSSVKMSKIYAPGWIEPVGHSPSHAPQSMQVSGLMLYWVAPSEMDSVGQTAAQAPQEMQVSSIT